MNTSVAIGFTVLLGVFYCWTSRINGLYFFGRTANATLRNSEDGRTITRQYLVGIVAATSAAAWLAWLGGHLGRHSISAASFLLELAAFFLIFARANGRVRNLEDTNAAASREPVIQVALLEQATYWIPGLTAILLPVAACAIAGLLAVMLAAQGAGLRAGWNAWSNSIDGQGYAELLGFATGLVAAAVGTLLLFRTSVRLRTRMAQYTMRSCIAMEWIGSALLFATVACSHVGVVISRTTERRVMFVAMAVALGVLVWNQSRSKRFVPPPVEVGGDDRWRWGLFYLDKNDPALFVQSRCGVGYTLNYGKRLAWPISLGLVAYVVVALFILQHHG